MGTPLKLPPLSGLSSCLMKASVVSVDCDQCRLCALSQNSSEAYGEITVGPVMTPGNFGSSHVLFIFVKHRTLWKQSRVSSPKDCFFFCFMKGHKISVLFGSVYSIQNFGAFFLLILRNMHFMCELCLEHCYSPSFVCADLPHFASDKLFVLPAAILKLWAVCCMLLDYHFCLQCLTTWNAACNA